MSSDDSDATLSELKRLLLGAETEQLARLSRRLDDLGIRAEELADVLPRAVRLHQRNPDDLVNALETPVTECVQRSVARDPHSFADALFPVMGPAIRRAIAEAMKGLVESLNQAMEHSLSAKGIAWRLEAMRTGAPFAEVVLRHTLAYRVEQAFLIQPASGLLIENVADQAAVGQDPDAVSGMLTAIESFVKDAFAAGDEEGLETVDVGDRKVWLIHGPYALLACVIRGMPPNSLREDLQEISESIHAQYASGLRTFDGDADDVAGVETDLRRCLISEQKPVEKSGQGVSFGKLALLGVLIGGLLWWGGSAWQGYTRQSRLAAAEARLVQDLNQTPGILITDHGWRDGTLYLSGMRDPATGTLDKEIAASGLAPDQVRFTWRAYHDLSPGFALARARQAFAPPPDTELSISDVGILRVSGVADPDWLTRVQRDAPLIAGIHGVDASAVTDPDSAILRAVQARLQVPETARLSVKAKVLHVAGTAPVAWLDTVQARVADVPNLAAVDLSRAVSDETLQAQALVESLNRVRVRFEQGALLDAPAQQALSAIADDLARLTTLAPLVGQQAQVVVKGRTDGSGSRRGNAELAARRASVFIGAMLARGLPGELFTAQALPGARASGEDPDLRRVELTVALTPMTR